MCTDPTPVPRVRVVAYDARWPDAFERAAAEASAALGPGVIAIHHIGSTSVPGRSDVSKRGGPRCRGERDVKQVSTFCAGLVVGGALLGSIQLLNAQPVGPGQPGSPVPSGEVGRYQLGARD